MLKELEMTNELYQNGPEQNQIYMQRKIGYGAYQRPIPPIGFMLTYSDSKPSSARMFVRKQKQTQNKEEGKNAQQN